MNLYVIDASVAVKWLLPAASEPLTDDALRLLRRYAEGKLRFAVPDLFWTESANILWKTLRQGRLTRAVKEEALATLMGITSLLSLRLIFLKKPSASRLRLSARSMTAFTSPSPSGSRRSW